MDDNSRPKISFSLGSAKPNEQHKVAAARQMSEKERRRAAEQAELEAVIAETEAYHSADISAPASGWSSQKRDRFEFQPPPTGPRGYDSRGRRQRKPDDDFDALFADAPPSLSERKKERQEALLRSEIDYDDLALSGIKRDHLGRPITRSPTLHGDLDDESSRATNAFHRYGNDEEENDMHADDLDKHSPRQTVVCSNLPPSYTADNIKQLLPSSLAVDNIMLLPPDIVNQSNRGAQQAIIWFGRQEKIRDIENGIRPLKSKYLGWGFELSIYLSLSSQVIKERRIDSIRDTVLPELRQRVKPFGAKRISEVKTLNKVAPIGIPTDETPSHGDAPEVVVVSTPRDVTTVKNIHKMIEAIIDLGPEDGQEFEATLMARPEIQMDPRYAFLYNDSSEAGKYYRWRLLEFQAMIHDGDNINVPDGDGPVRLFNHEGVGTFWNPPPPLKFEHVLDFPDIVKDPDFASSQEDSNEDGMGMDMGDDFCLGPLKQAQLTWLLETLPVPPKPMIDGNIEITCYDIACVTAFAMRHAKAGLKEIVEILVDNVEDPFNVALERNEENRKIAIETALARRNAVDRDCDDHSGDDHMVHPTQADSRLQHSPVSYDEQEDAAEPDAGGLGYSSGGTRRPSSAGPHPDQPMSDDESEEVKAEKARRKRFQDANAHIVGLGLITDILGNIDYSPDTFKYREAFEAELRESGTFELLSKIPNELGMGAMTKRDWRDSIHQILRVWADKSMIMGVDDFKAAFDRPIAEEKARREEEDRIRQEHAAEVRAAAEAEKSKLPAKKRKVLNVVEYNSEGEAYEAVVMVTDSEAEHETETADQPALSRNVAGLTVSVEDIEVPVEETDFDDQLFDDEIDGRLLSKKDPVIKYYLNAAGVRPEPEDEMGPDSDDEG